MIQNVSAARDNVFRASFAISRRFAQFLSLSDHNRLLRISLGHALLAWIGEYLPKRWNREYAIRLGYGFKYDDQSINRYGRTPFFKTGTMLKNATMARPIVVAKGGFVEGVVRFPIGHPINPEVLRSFKLILPEEARFVANAMLRAARMVANGIPPPAPTITGTLRQSMSLAQRRESNMFGKSNKIGMSDTGQLTAMHKRFSAEIMSRKRGHHIGIYQGDASAPGETAPAFGRQNTQRGANWRYRHTDHGRQARAAQKRLARNRYRMRTRAKFVSGQLDPAQFHANYVRSVMGN